MTKRPAKYELRRGRLYLDGEEVGIDRRLIGAVLARCQAESGRAVAKEIRTLPRRIVERILEVDRLVGLARLKAALLGLGSAV